MSLIHLPVSTNRCTYTCVHVNEHKPFPVTRESSQLMLTLPGGFGKLPGILGTLLGVEGVVTGGAVGAILTGADVVVQGGTDDDNTVKE